VRPDSAPGIRSVPHQKAHHLRIASQNGYMDRPVLSMFRPLKIHDLRTPAQYVNHAVGVAALDGLT
jgi:hypothetical protein